MGQLALNFMAAHQQYFVGIAIGIVLSNPGTLAVWAFNVFVRIPGVGQWIAANPDKAKAWADQFDKAIDACVDKYAAAQAPNASAAPKP